MNAPFTVVGPPCAGKSTWSAEVAAASGQHVLSMDEVVIREAPDWTHEREWEEWARMAHDTSSEVRLIDGSGGLFFRTPDARRREAWPALSRVAVVRPVVRGRSIADALIDRIRRRAHDQSPKELSIAEEWLRGPEGRALAEVDRQYGAWAREGYPVVNIVESGARHA